MAVKAAQDAALQLKKKDKKAIEEEGGAGLEGPPELVKKFKKETPGQNVAEEKRMRSFKDYMKGSCNE